MRDIKFKAKRKDNQEWVYGHLVINNKNLYSGKKENVYYIAYNTDMYVEAIPETICEYTGLKDTNGVEIYENDIVKAKYEENNGFIKWNNDNASFQVKGIPSHTLKRADELEVIGNIYDKEVE